MSTALSPDPDVVIIGGGINGTSAAAFLAAAGARVVLVESEGLAARASGANSGVIQHPFDPVLEGLYHDTVALYRELSTLSSGFRMPAEPAGMLFVAEREEDARRQAASISESFPELKVEVLGEAELLGLEPNLGSDLWACRVGIGYPIMPGSTTYAYATLAESHGAQIRLGHEATLETDRGAVVGVRVKGELVRAGAVLIAAGPWSPALIDPTGSWAPIQPVWGVVVELELADAPGHVLEQAGIDASLGVSAGSNHREHVFSLVSVPGVSVVGSTFLAREPDPEDWMVPILRHAARYVPSIADAPIRSFRACPRPQAADGRPLVGAVPGIANLFVCGGHGPWGISTGPASARLVTDLILGRQPDVPGALDPARFGLPPGALV